MVAHEMIFDFRQFKDGAGPAIDELDVAKRLMDYGFHAPTVSFPVAGTLMIEPTESESKEELDRFCDAMISIRKEIQAVLEAGAMRRQRAQERAAHRRRHRADDWSHPYSREQAAFPLPYVARQVLAVRRPDRQPVRRPQPDLRVSADRRNT